MAKTLKEHNYYSIDSTIVADSVNEFGHRLTSFVCSFPRHLLSELNTHRMFSRNSASSRAIPAKEMIRRVKENPFTPMAWQEEHSGMQGNVYITEEERISDLKYNWLQARDNALSSALHLSDLQTTKQISNRLLEPFLYHTAIITATHFDNFFNQRCPQYYFEPSNLYFKSQKDWLKEYEEEFKDYRADFETTPLNTPDFKLLNKGGGEIHIMALAESMWDNYNENTPKLLNAGEWHIPFGDNIDEEKLWNLVNSWEQDRHLEPAEVYFDTNEKGAEETKRKIAVARCARISYGTFEGKEDYEADINLYEKLVSYPHPSPMEHLAQCMTHREVSIHKKVWANKKGEIVTEYGWLRNFQGFKQLRAEIG